MIHPSDDNDAHGVGKPTGNSLDSLSTEEFLRIVGLRVRSQRASLSMSRKRLAEVSGVSERYLAQLESGQGNMSIALLRKVTTAIGMSLAALLSADTPELGSDASQSTEGCSNNSAQSPMADGGIRLGYGRDDSLKAHSHRLP